MMHSNKKEYTAPKLKKCGAVEKVTGGSQSGSQTDADFPVDTPRDELTFS